MLKAKERTAESIEALLLSRLQSYRPTYTETLKDKILRCENRDKIERADKYKYYLIHTMGISLETACRCTIDLYFS